jgi:UDP-galactopyranose mutase
MFAGADIRLGVDFDQHRGELAPLARHIVYTGPIDAYYDFCDGPLAYRSLRFETKELSVPNYQGVAVMNYTAADVPYTRIIEHKHFEFGEQPQTVVTWEYPKAWHPGEEPYYPVNDDANQALYQRYQERAVKEKHLSFGGRLGNYRYTDMQDTVKDAWALWRELEGDGHRT